MWRGLLHFCCVAESLEDDESLGDGRFVLGDYEDVGDWAERLTMAAEVRDLTPDKLFKIAKLNLRGRAKEWFRRLQPAPTDWAELRTLMIQKYGNIDVDDI